MMCLVCLPVSWKVSEGLYSLHYLLSLYRIPPFKVQQYTARSCWRSFGFSLLSLPLFCPRPTIGQHWGVRHVCVTAPAEGCREQQRHRHSSLSVSCSWHLSSRAGTLAVLIRSVLPSLPTKACSWNCWVFLLWLSLLLKISKEYQCIVFSHRSRIRNSHSSVFSVQTIA